MADVCPDCGRPVGTGRLECGARLMGAIDEDHDDCLNEQIASLQAQLAAANACIEAADRMRDDTPCGNLMDVYDAARAEYERVRGT